MVYHRGPSTLEGLENFLQFLLPGGFYSLLRAHYENPGVSRTWAENSNWGERNTKGVLLWSMQQAIQTGYGIRGSPKLIWSQSQKGKWIALTFYMYRWQLIILFVIILFNSAISLDETFSVLKKWEKCMVQAVGMIGKNENSNVRRGRWLSSLRCIHLFLCSFPELSMFVRLSHALLFLFLFSRA